MIPGVDDPSEPKISEWSRLGGTPKLKRLRVTSCKNATGRTEFADDLPRVRGDRIQLQQVVLNLLANSSEAMSDVEDCPSHLLIRTERHDGAQVCVTVRDAGMGFHPRDAERLFQALYTIQSNGMGMGLFISRAIIEIHRGRKSGPRTSIRYRL